MVPHPREQYSSDHGRDQQLDHPRKAEEVEHLAFDSFLHHGIRSCATQTACTNFHSHVRQMDRELIIDLTHRKGFSWTDSGLDDI